MTDCLWPSRMHDGRELRVLQGSLKRNSCGECAARDVAVQLSFQLFSFPSSWSAVTLLLRRTFMEKQEWPSSLNS